MAIIHIPTPLRPYTGGQASVEVAGATVAESLAALTTAHPDLARHLRDNNGKLRSFVNVYLGDEDIRFLDGEATAIDDGAELTIVPSIAGGNLPDLSNEEVARYSRHLILEEVGLEGQKKLKAASVLCVGTGGLGSPLLMYLAAAGVGRIGIVDFDVVDPSNLQRQIIHGTSQVGVPKVISAKQRIHDINPNVQVDIYEEPLSSENAIRILEPYDVVVDGTDNFPTRYLVNDACVLLGKPNVYGSIFKFEGQASVFNYGDGPNYRDLYPEPPPPGLVPSCAEGGVLGILPGLIGTIQATETVKILLGKGNTLSGRLLLYDALNMRFRELKLRRDPEAKPITELIDYEQFCGVPMNDHEIAEPTGAEGYQCLSVNEAKEKLDAGWKPYVLDVRKPHEAQIVTLSFADRLQPHEDVLAIAGELPTDRPILVYCKTGGRSGTAAEILAQRGFEVFNLEGGIKAWATEIDTSLPVY
ncbi:MAG: molybdopterin-synthase adenylyltransferase MoeB [Deltaproteobacteria bacterium]|nr:MAG: molybdopterin-synthase adenylyltransferase MoeB [Deltaproteobacteria bacterium]